MIGTVEQNIIAEAEIPVKPVYIPLEDGIVVGPEPGVAKVDPVALVGAELTLLFE